LYRLKEHGKAFKLIVIGGKARTYPKIFDEAQEILSDEIIQWAYVESYEAYLELLNKADFLPVTSNQEFFGISVMEAIMAGAVPILPNRLVYPEHFGSSEFQSLFYNDDDELYQRLIEFLDNPIQENLKKDLIKRAKEYLWQQQIQRYDLIFESLVFE